ncbi:MAG: O-antigen ligase family protein [Sphingomicrobium sp.]
MKWVFLLAVLALAPVLAGMLRSQPRYLVHTCFVLGVLLFVLAPRLWTAPIAWPAWPAPVKGIEISFVDAISVALIASTRGVRIPLSIKLSFSIYCFAIVVSTFAAFQPMAAIFYAWQLLRTVLLMIAIARVCVSEPRAPAALFAGLGVGLMYEAALVVWQYLRGVGRPGGNFGHPNFLALGSEFAVFTTLSLMLGSRRLLWPAATVMAAFLIAVLGGSRAALGLFGLGVILTTLLSIRHKATSRKYAFAGTLAVLLLASTPVMIWAASRRTEAAKASSDTERAAMKSAARMIIADHPFGVGANQYVVVTNTGGYSARAGVAWNEDNRAAPVHDTYYLITAELGFIGLIGLLAILGSFVALGFRALGRHIPGEQGELVPGLLATMILVAIHINFEFVFMDFVLHYLFAVTAGMLIAIASRATIPARAGTAAGAQPAAAPAS